MTAEDAVSWKVIDIVLASLVFLTLLGAAYTVFSETHTLQVKTSKDITMLRDTAQSGSGDIINASYPFSEKLTVTPIQGNECKIQVKNNKNVLREDCSFNLILKITESVNQPINKEQGVYMLDVLQ